MNKPALHLGIITENISINYGEGFGNVATLKKFTRSDGTEYPYASPQKLSYCIKSVANFIDTPVEKSGTGKTVWQFSKSATIKEYPEIDFSGYLKTESTSKGEKKNEAEAEDNKSEGSRSRTKVLRVSPLIALEPYRADMDYQTNLSLVKRGGGEGSNIVQNEIQYSYCTYTVSVDLDRLGIDENDKIKLPNDEKIKRMNVMLDAIQFLYADIKGRRENLSPIFVIGGIYRRKNPFFLNRIKFTEGHKLNIIMLKDTIKDAGIQEDTIVGYLDTSLDNNEEIINEFNPMTIGEFFNELKKRVVKVYSE
ncbi:CRISPR-associated protein Cas7/Cst2/DevR [Thermoclostridium stercorarium subsp. stercorarium DSM 8532]|jgi:CRISPR-associated protein Cst2|uniref:CRISPR-associated protein Cas7/Cst2/DevR n=3 Tax=Thermoclostridium stercorarium TaxID=1510 RepID=L7VQ91_THES1|nr:type I-B CRISPR-associated protein Cas7/Cst2/DevR [Thermoclostridium stercorarium]AGC68869.1 CRISPR-associated protein Cas7/Cst2/DevR [Thermoclostridium stercorarium subsp. stercorarium DSM 8532]AGI39867.1 CRISPR autoregulator [Thermoclostridium stercorarium subsp. stercorarium DSM 8532]ANW99176.1 type I-B CRISPR-associated protein Cas7/Cst2/DevR [Thermoclostridium stercorarium subsp. thermolacticum DSM 2910]ANX01734.1 type I-B CRISPR-associated protein Cas7/Cst2/DevR [Thermoclostridium ster